MGARVFGLDIGRSFIKVVQVENRGGKKYLSAASLTAVPSGGIQSESALDLSKISDTIKSLISSANIQADKCVISLVESQVVSRLIQLPPLTDKELSAAVKWEAEQYIPLPIKDVVLHYQVVSKPAVVEQGGKMDVLLVAAPKRVVEKYLNIVKNAGFQVEAMETESQALVRSLTRIADPPSLIVSMGALSTELVVAQEGHVLFTRSIATGGANLTRAIIAEFNLPQKQAEEYKETYGILEDKLSGKVAALLKPILDIVINEILKAMDFYHSHYPEASVSRVVICGGGAFLPGLSEFLVERTSLEVSLADPWMDFAKEGPIVTLAGQGSVYAVATGLAVRT